MSKEWSRRHNEPEHWVGSEESLGSVLGAVFGDEIRNLGHFASNLTQEIEKLYANTNAIMSRPISVYS